MNPTGLNTLEALREIMDLDLDLLAGAEPPIGFGSD